MTQQPEPKPQPHRSILRDLAPSKGQLMGLAIGLLTVSNIGAWAMLATNKAPKVVTVGITEMTQGFIARESLGKITPEEARLRMEAYLAVSQDTLKRIAVEDGVVVLARECVLAGEHADWTKVVDAAVKTTMQAALGQTPAPKATPVSNAGLFAKNGAGRD